MPVTFSPTKHQAETFQPDLSSWSAEVLLKAVFYPRFKAITGGQVLQSSFGHSNTDIIRPCQNGFVHTVLEAYNHHRALIIRPDDVWLAIILLFSRFVNGNAEELRSQFVSHDGKQELVVTAWDARTRRSADYGRLAREMSREIERNVSDPKLCAWILPAFTTTSAQDTIVASIAMMATFKQYFSYRMRLRCGIPRVTLEGEKADWENILNRLEKLKEYGLQTVTWYYLLHPVITRFVKAFDSPDAPENLDFWSKVAHYEGGGSGPTWLHGWITAFCVFGDEGKWLGVPFKAVRWSTN